MHRGLVLLALASIVHAQPAKRLEVEVASIKRTPPREKQGPAAPEGCRGGPGTNDPELLMCADMSLASLAWMAYQIDRLQYYRLRAPDWMRELPGYDLTARVPAGATKDDLATMAPRATAAAPCAVVKNRDCFEVKARMPAQGGVMTSERLRDNVHMALRQHAEQLEAGYDEDFFQWTQCTAKMIRQGQIEGTFGGIDWEHVAEEIEDMGKRDRREVRSRLIVLLAHLLKWQFQPELQTPSWRATIVEQRLQLDLILADSPSLRRIPRDELSQIYPQSVKWAAGETGLLSNRFPPACPYTPEQILDNEFFPII